MDVICRKKLWFIEKNSNFYKKVVSCIKTLDFLDTVILPNGALFLPHQNKMFMFIFSAVLGEIFGTKWRNPVKLDRKRNVWYQLLHVFWQLLPKFNLWKEDWALGYVSTQIWDFPNIFLFPKILSLKLFGNSWGNSYTKFAILDITFCFTCG